MIKPAYQPCHGDQLNSARSAFTLIELMISIAMVLVLLVGVNQVFTYTTKAVGAGNALNDAIRDSRAAQTTFANDLGSAATTDGPFVIIHSAQVYAFQNRADYAADKDQDASTYTVTTADDTSVAPTKYNFRNHRVDTLEFFTRGHFADTTGNASYTLPTVTSNEARVWYGMTLQPSSTYLNPNDTGYVVTGVGSSFVYPGIKSGYTSPTAVHGDSLTQNPNNFFASDWVLGRVSTLLVPAPAAGTMIYSYKSGGTEWTSDAAATELSPLNENNVATDTSGNSWESQWSRCDLAQTSINNYTAQLTSFLGDTGNSGTSRANWWNTFFVGSFGGASGQLYQCNPYFNSTTLTAPADLIKFKAALPARVARTTPYLVKGCTQFIVEFAGDFVQQDNNLNLPGVTPTQQNPSYGQVTGFVTTSDGKADGIDYQLIQPSAAVTDRRLWQKHIRWYGLPRNVSGTVPITGNSGALYNSGSKTFAPGIHSDANDFTNVVPLRDVLATNNLANVSLADLKNALNATVIAGTPVPAWIERQKVGLASTVTDTAAPADYSGTGMTNGADYAVAWGPDSDAAGIPRPKMIRITMTLQDPNGQLANGQTYQYVYTLP